MKYLIVTTKSFHVLMAESVFLLAFFPGFKKAQLYS